MSTEVYLASLMAKRFAGSTENSEESVGDIVPPDKVSDFTFSGKDPKLKTILMEEQWPTFQNGSHFHHHRLYTKPRVDILSKAPTSWTDFILETIEGQHNFFGLNTIKSKLKRFHVFLCTTIVTIAACLSPREKPKANNRWKSKSVILVKKKQSSYQVSMKNPNFTPSHVLNAYANLVILCRITVLQTLERIKRLWKSKVFESYNYDDLVNVLQNQGNLLLNSDHSSDIQSEKQGANLLCATIESEILSSSHRGMTSERANFSSTQVNQNTTARNQSANSNSSERSTMDEIIAEELAALAGQVNQNTSEMNESENANSTSERALMGQIIAEELAALAGQVGDVFDVPLDGGDNYSDELNANILREDSIWLYNLDNELEDSDFDPIESEGGDYEYETSSYGNWPLPQMSPSPTNDHIRRFKEAHAAYIANFDNQVMLNSNNFGDASESDDEVEAPVPKRPRLSDPEQDPKSPTN